MYTIYITVGNSSWSDTVISSPLLSPSLSLSLSLPSSLPPSLSLHPSSLPLFQLSVQDTSNDEAIARALEEEERSTPVSPSAVNNSTGQGVRGEGARADASKAGEQDYHIARVMQEECDEELAQAIHRYQQSQQEEGATPRPAPLSE